MLFDLLTPPVAASHVPHHIPPSLYHRLVPLLLIAMVVPYGFGDTTTFKLQEGRPSGTVVGSLDVAPGNGGGRGGGRGSVKLSKDSLAYFYVDDQLNLVTKVTAARACLDACVPGRVTSLYF